MLILSPRKYLGIIAFALLAFPGIMSAEEAPTERGIAIAPKTQEQLLKTLYNKRYAVVVGINKYPQAVGILPPLQAAVNDALRVEKQLTQLGFDEVTTLLDEKATNSAIVETLGDYIGEKAQENDLVVFFFAGHGDTKGEGNEQMGFILPYDYNPKKHMSTSISMSTLNDISKRLKAKHMLYVMDSCFSGGILKTRAASPLLPSKGILPYLKNLTQSRAHVVITAGGQNEVSHEEGGSGLFTRVFLEGLSGKADRGKGVITASTLALYVQENLPDYLHGTKQNPQYGRLLGEGDVILSLIKPLDSTQETIGPGPSMTRETEEVLKKEMEKLKKEMHDFQEKQARAFAEQERQAALEREKFHQEEARHARELEAARKEMERAAEERNRLEKKRGSEKSDSFIAPSFHNPWISPP